MSRTTSRVVGASCAAVLLTLAAMLLAGTAVPAAAHPPRILTLPFPTTRGIHVEDGWWRVDGSWHHGIDYIKGAVGKGWTWESFPVVAAAPGRACAALDDEPGCIIGVGTRVLIRHKLPNGKVVYTYYGHLKRVSPAIAVGTGRFSTWVKRGQLLGWAGKTGLPGTGTHLHFELMWEPGDWIDPYDIDGRRAAYPDPAGHNARTSGLAYWWTERIPVPPPASTTATRAS